VDRAPVPRGRSRRRLSVEERQRVLLVLHEDRFVDKAPRQVFAALLDEGTYLCSVSTMYRILRENGEVRERRNQLRHPKHTKPELLATAPKEVWSYDITKLRGPVRGSFYYLYVIIDIYSRYVVGWTIASTESAEIVERLIARTCRQEKAGRKLVIHSDRGAPMTSNCVADLLSNLGVMKSFSRPRVSNDNAYSESHFKTLKNVPLFPGRFGSIQDARAFCRVFFDYYNNEHYHTGIALMTPAVVHGGLSDKCNEARQIVIDRAFASNPDRFVRGRPRLPQVPETAWINNPAKSSA
jgi:putative transposase